MDNCVIRTFREVPLVMQHGAGRTKLKSENSTFKTFLADTSLLGASYDFSLLVTYTLDCNSICPFCLSACE